MRTNLNFTPEDGRQILVCGRLLPLSNGAIVLQIQRARNPKQQRAGALRNFLAPASLALLIQAAGAQTWQTVDDFQYVLGASAEDHGLAVAPNGTLFASGLAGDAAGIWHGVVMASSDAGVTWSGPVDDYVYGPGNQVWYDGGLVADSAGNIYVAGQAYGNDPTNHWIVRRSTDGGSSWALVDDFGPGSSAAQPYGVTADAAGNVYVIGMANHASLNDFVWTVRRGLGGTSFTTVDTFGGNAGSQAQAIYADPTAGIFAVGSANVPGTKGYKYTTAWIVRRSTDRGATWSTVDSFQLSQNVTSCAFGVGADPHGNLYVVGQGLITSGKNHYGHWIVRKSTNGGTSWSTVDNYQLGTSANSAAVGFVADSSGNLFVAGWGEVTSGGNRHWIVRKNPGGTGAWATDDDFQYVSGPNTQPFAITANASGNVFVGGAGSSSSEHWLVRKK
jgi:hypothetical protein